MTSARALFGRELALRRKSNFRAKKPSHKEASLAPGLSLAIAALATIALLAIIHRAILAAFLACWLIRGKCSHANHRCEEREENFRVTFHTIFNLRRQARERQRKDIPSDFRTLPVA
jgi:hypothetical protein